MMNSMWYQGLCSSKNKLVGRPKEWTQYAIDRTCPVEHVKYDADTCAEREEDEARRYPNARVWPPSRTLQEEH